MMNALGPANRAHDLGATDSLARAHRKPARDEGRKRASSSVDIAHVQATRAKLDDLAVDREDVDGVRTRQVAAFHEDCARTRLRECTSSAVRFANVAYGLA